MTCDGCAKDISGALHKLHGITKVETNVKDQLVSIEGTGMPMKSNLVVFYVSILLTLEHWVRGNSGTVSHSCSHPSYWERRHPTGIRELKQ